jgi:mannose-6-phosphate isomerase-like protein (cupin superfamily)
MSASRLIPLAVILCGVIATHHGDSGTAGVPTEAEYVRIYSGDDGESHFERVKLPLKLDPAAAQPLSRSSAFSTGEFAVIGAPKDWAYTWHTAPRRQFVLVLQGTMEVEVEGGHIETFEAGGVLLADDLSGHGHLTRGVGSMPLLIGVIPLVEP